MREQTSEARAGAARAGCWRGSVFLRGERTFYLGEAAETSAHAAHEIKVCVALRGEFRLRTEDDPRWRTYRAAVIPPQQLHLLDGRGAHVCLIYFPPEVSDSGRLFCGRGARSLPDAAVERRLPRLRSFLEGGYAGEEFVGLCDELVGELSRSVGDLRPLDRRVAGALAYLRAEAEGRVSADEISRAVALSPSRLAHLFREQVGLPVRQYALGLRLRRALGRMSADDSLTSAAHEVGFADSAHLSRTFRRMVGLSPSSLTRHSRFFRAAP